MQVLLGYFVTPPLESLGAGYKTGNKLFLVLWGPLNTSRPVACFQHEIPTGAIFLTYAPRLWVWITLMMESKADSESGNKELSPPGIF